MGIPCFYSYIVRNHVNIIKKINGRNIENLYLDSNSIIYDAVSSLNYQDNIDNYESKLIEIIIKNIDKLIDSIKPTKQCMIAFDGVAPVAKLKQQRDRRFRGEYERKINSGIGIKTEHSWDKTAITPGTSFMNFLNMRINNYYQENNTNNKNLRFIVSGSNREGEGEHKIFEYIRNNKSYHLNTDTIIYGLDADLIMLSLNHYEICNHIFLYRETPTFIKNIDASLDPSIDYLLDITLLAMTINEDFSADKSNLLGRNSIKDYIFLCFLLGNDFLPHNPSINIRTNGIDILINHYRETIVKNNTFLIIDNKIQWNNVKTLIKSLTVEEHKRIREDYIKRESFKVTNICPEKKLLMLPMIDRRTEKYINPLEHKWQQRYYKQLFNCSNVYFNDTLKNICINYLEGLEWTMEYYSSGCKNWMWKYNYAYAPLLNDLITHVPSYNLQLVDTIKKQAIHPYTQLAYVLPKSGHHLLPKGISEICRTKYNYMYEDNHLVWAFCKYFWESHIVFPNVDINNLEKDIKLF